MANKRKGRVVVLHLAFRYPLAGVIWQLVHHLVGLRRLGLDVYYVEDHGAYVYDPIAATPVPDASANLDAIGRVLARFGFADRWSFRDPVSGVYQGLGRERVFALMREADAVINLCAATNPREEHLASRCLIYLETDPGPFQARLQAGDAIARHWAASHRLFFTYGYNLGTADCLLPACGIDWHRTRPPVLLDYWRPADSTMQPAVFTTVGTWINKGNDVQIGGETYRWSKHVNFDKVLNVPALAGQPSELATDIASGPYYELALKGGFAIRPVIPMSLDIDEYRRYITSSRGEFTVAKDIYARTRSGWFSDRTACYLAAGRPAVTQWTGFEKSLPAGEGLLGFEDAAQAVDALRQINGDYPRHARAARELACEYFDALKLLDHVMQVAGL
jgi:hypothetical protein